MGQEILTFGDMEIEIEKINFSTMIFLFFNRCRY